MFVVDSLIVNSLREAGVVSNFIPYLPEPEESVGFLTGTLLVNKGGDVRFSSAFYCYHVLPCALVSTVIFAGGAAAATVPFFLPLLIEPIWSYYFPTIFLLFYMPEALLPLSALVALIAPYSLL